MTSKILGFIAGLLVGAAVCAIVLNSRFQNEKTAPATAADSTQSEIADLRSQLDASKARLEKANAEIDRLTASAQQLLTRANALTNTPVGTRKSGFAAMFGGDGTNQMSEAMSGMMKTATEQQMESKLAGMKAKLNLTPEQEAAIRDLMTKQMDKGLAVAQQMLKGELSREEMEKVGSESKNVEEQIKALLTPEQLIAYSDYQKEENTRMARLVANAELMQMQGALHLTDEQQDKVFSVLADQSVKLMDASSGNPAGASDFWRRQMENRAEALRDVLTPEQLESYRKLQAQQMKMYEMFMPKNNAGAAGN